MYLQYSTRQEIVNSTRSVEQGGNVLLVSLENLSVSLPFPVTSPSSLMTSPLYRPQKRLHHMNSSSQPCLETLKCTELSLASMPLSSEDKSRCSLMHTAQ